MGWRTQNNYDDYTARQRRRLPWRERHNWLHLVIDGVVALGAFGATVWWLLR
ncbi:MAG: hypothetical protein JWQ59_1328 [Cryobacterium sp.]|nr:hypothetical protein [Cryobacterium sp.]